MTKEEKKTELDREARCKLLETVYDFAKCAYENVKKERDVLYRTNRRLTWTAILITVMLWIVVTAYMLK